MKTNDKEKELFELLNSIGGICAKGIHVLIDIDPGSRFDDTWIRVYHKDGYCFDVNKTANYDIETDAFIGWTYDIFSEWDGFLKIDTVEAIELIKDTLNLHK